MPAFCFSKRKDLLLLVVNIDLDPVALSIYTAAQQGEMFASREVNSQLLAALCQRVHLQMGKEMDHEMLPGR